MKTKFPLALNKPSPRATLFWKACNLTIKFGIKLVQSTTIKLIITPQSCFGNTKTSHNSTVGSNQNQRIIFLAVWIVLTWLIESRQVLETSTAAMAPYFTKLPTKTLIITPMQINTSIEIIHGEIRTEFGSRFKKALCTADLRTRVATIHRIREQSVNQS